jgi:hypothetical protein
MEYKLKTGPQGHVYLPKRVREVFGQKFKFLPNSHAAALYAEDTEPQVVIDSLLVIIADLKLRVKKETSE